MPQLSSADAATKAVQDLVHALKNPHLATPFATLGNEQGNALDQLALIFTASFPHQRDKNETLAKSSEPSTSIRDKMGTPQNPITAPHIPPNSTELEAAAPAPRVISPLPEVDSPVTRRTSNRYMGGPLCRPNPTHRYPTRAHTSLNASLPRVNHVATVTGAIFPLPTTVLQHVAHSVLDPLTGQSLEYRQLSQGRTKVKWIQWIYQRTRTPRPRCWHSHAHRHENHSFYSTRPSASRLQSDLWTHRCHNLPAKIGNPPRPPHRWR
jgi:hypothetical protein